MNTQGRAVHLTAEIHLLFEVVMAICHPPGIAEEVLLFEEMMATNHPLGIAGFLHFCEQVIVSSRRESHGCPRGRDCFTSAEKHMFIVFAS